MRQEIIINIANTELWLLADKALYWPEQQILCIADAHFGKAAAYRALGQPVPHGTTSNNLSRLDVLLERYATRRIIFLGDFLHAPKSHAPATMAALHEWRQRNNEVICTLIRGNHDLRAGDPPANLAFEIINEPLVLGPFSFRHTPQAHLDYHVIAGHVHPVFKLNGKGRQTLKLPCFYSTDNVMILPSFGIFTGGFLIEPEMNSQMFVTDNSNIWPIQIK